MKHDAALARECRTFTRYLIGSEPGDYVQGKYAHAHAVSEAYRSGDRFDLLLLRLAARHPLLTRLADSYAGLLAPAALLRRKLVLLLAILETCAPSSLAIDRLATGSWPVLLLRLSARGLVTAAALLLGTVLLLPARLALARNGRARA